MYEMKHKSLAGHLLCGDFPAEQLEAQAIEKYSDVPNFMTCARHAALQDKTPVHCLLQGDTVKVNFLVPKQFLDSRQSPNGHRYLILVVVKEKDLSGKYFKLVMCQDNRTGFLLNNTDL